MCQLQMKLNRYKWFLHFGCCSLWNSMLKSRRVQFLILGTIKDCYHRLESRNVISLLKIVQNLNKRLPCIYLEIRSHWQRSPCPIAPQPIQPVRDSPRTLLSRGPCLGCRVPSWRHYSCSLSRLHFFTDFVYALGVDHYYSEEDPYWIWWESNPFGLRYGILNYET